MGSVRSGIFFNFLVKTLGGCFGAQGVDFDDSRSRDGCGPMDSSSFRGRDQDLSRSFHVYQISALYYFWSKLFIKSYETDLVTCLIIFTKYDYCNFKIAIIL